jgi:predicted nucleic acid-binding protein
VAGRALADTSALLAVASRDDQYHVRATEVGRHHLRAGGRLVSTTLVLSELHARLLYRRGPAEARRIVGILLDDPVYEWLEASAELVRAAVSAWLERFADQHFSLTDAVSFEVMRREKLRTAFAFDDHFLTAGFEVLR